MTKIDFYLIKSSSSSEGAQARQLFSMSLIQKIFGLGHQIFVHTEDAELSQKVSELLWSFQSSSFLAHQLEDDISESKIPQPQTTSQLCRITVGHARDHDSAPLTNNDVLVNLSNQVPSFFSRYNRVVEIVSQDDKTKENLRKNYSFYKERGYPLQSHDLRK